VRCVSRVSCVAIVKGSVGWPAGKDSKQQQKKMKKEETTETKKKKKKKTAGGKDSEEESATSSSSSTELDLANLIKHKLVDLRNFCREKGIAVRSRNKQGYVDAIEAWQKQQPKPSGTTTHTHTHHRTHHTRTHRTRTILICSRLCACTAAAKRTEAAKAAAAAAAPPSEKPATQDKGKEKVGDAAPTTKAGEAEANGGKLPRPLDRITRLALLEEEGAVRRLNAHQWHVHGRHSISFLCVCRVVGRVVSRAGRACRVVGRVVSCRVGGGRGGAGT